MAIPSKPRWDQLQSIPRAIKWAQLGHYSPETQDLNAEYYSNRDNRIPVKFYPVRCEEPQTTLPVLMFVLSGRAGASRSTMYTEHSSYTMYQKIIIPRVAFSSSASQMTPPMNLPPKLARPAFQEVLRENLLLADPDLTDVDPAHVRESLVAFGPSYVVPFPTTALHLPVYPRLLETFLIMSWMHMPDGFLPEELPITVHDLTTAPPSHMVAVYSLMSMCSASGPAVGRGPCFNFYPVHSIYLAAHCAHLPNFPTIASTWTPPIVTPGATSATYMVPVQSLCLPSPVTYPLILGYLYTKRADLLISEFLPTPVPVGLLAAATRGVKDHKAMRDYADHLAAAYTLPALLNYAVLVEGFWMNACTLGIVDHCLWEVIDVAWRVLMHAFTLQPVLQHY